MMKKIIIFLVLALACGVSWGATHKLFFDSKFTGTSTGDSLTPYKLLSTPNTTVATWRGAGDTVNFFLRDSSIFREAWTIPTGNGLLTLQRYGNLGRKPEINVAVVATGWATTAYDNVWGYRVTQTVGKVWINDTLLNQKATPDLLSDLEWSYDGEKDTLFLKITRGNPNLLSDIIERTTVTNTINFSGKNNMVFDGINFKGSRSKAITATTASDNVRVYNSDFKDNSTSLALALCTNYLFSGCTFTNNVGVSGACIELNASSTKFVNCLFKNSPIQMFALTGTGNHKIINCTFTQIKGNYVNNGASDSCYIINSILCNPYPSSGYILNSVGGGMLVKNSYVAKNTYDFTVGINGADISFENEKKYDLGFVSVSRIGMLSNSEDDYNNIGINYALQKSAYSVDTNYQTSLSLHACNKLTSNDKQLLQKMVGINSEIVSHSMSHSYYDVDNKGATNLRYTGAASYCRVEVDTINWLVKFMPDGVEDFSVDISFSNNRDMEWFDNTVNAHSGYSSTRTVNSKALTWVMKSDTLADIKAAVDSLVLDTSRFFYWEFDASKDSIEAVTGKPCIEYTWPGGLYSDLLINRVKAAGYLGARSTTPGTYLLDNYALYALRNNSHSARAKCVMRLDNNTNSSVNSTNFTPVNITYNSSIQAEYNGCAVLNGSAYMYRNDASFNYNSGDFVVGVWIRPTNLNAINTILYTGTDNNNYFTVYVDVNGALHWKQVENGVSVTDVYSSNNKIALNTWTRVAFRQTIDSISVFIGDSVPALERVIYSYTNKKPSIYNGITYLGTSWDFNNSQPKDYFTGYFDKVDIGFDIWFNTICLVNQLCEYGGYSTSLSHGDELGPRDLYYTSFCAMANTQASKSKKFKLIGLGSAVKMMRDSGVISSDSLYITWQQKDLADYRLLSSSKLSGAGDASVLTGVPNLVNLSGDTITDASGTLLVSNVNIGAYGMYNENTRKPSLIQDTKSTIRGILRGFRRGLGL